MFKDIFDYYEKEGMIHPLLRYSLEGRVKYLESQKEFVRREMMKIIEIYNFHNLKNITNDINQVFQIEFFKGVDDFTLWFGLNAVLDYDYDNPVFKDEGYESNDEQLTDEKYEELSRKYEEQDAKHKRDFAISAIDSKIYRPIYYSYFIETLNWYFSARLTYTWLAYQWQEVGGCEIGMRVGTLENNSVTRFSFNDFSFDDLSKYSCRDEPIKEFVQPAFPRKLSLIEIFIRTGIKERPTHLFCNHWRYFEKENEFIEIGIYANKSKIRKGKIKEPRFLEEEEIKNHIEKYAWSNEITLKYLINFSNQKINEGWEEKLRPLSFPKRIYDLAIDFPHQRWTRRGNYEEILMLINVMEEEDDIVFSNSFKAFLSYLNVDIPNWFFFPINDVEKEQVEQFYSFEKISSFIKERNSETWDKYLPFAKSKEGTTLFIFCATEESDFIFGKKENEEGYNLVFNSFDEFINNKTN